MGLEPLQGGGGAEVDNTNTVVWNDGWGLGGDYETYSEEHWSGGTIHGVETEVTLENDGMIFACWATRSSNTGNFVYTNLSNDYGGYVSGGGSGGGAWELRDEGTHTIWFEDREHAEASGTTSAGFQSLYVVGIEWK